MIKTKMTLVTSRLLEEMLLRFFVVCRKRSFFKTSYYRFLTTILPRSAPRLFVDPFECIGAAVVTDGDYYEWDYINCLKLYLSELNQVKTLYVDVGANIGNHIVSMAGYFDFAIGFEPINFNFFACNANISYNGLDDIVKIYRCALGDSTGKVNMSLPTHATHLSGVKRNNGMYSVLPETSDFVPSVNTKANSKRHRRFSVPVRKGDSMLGEYITSYDRIVIKLDCEGYETSVMCGLRGIFEAASIANGDFIIAAEFLSLESFEDMEAILNSFCNIYGYCCQYMVCKNGKYCLADSLAVRKQIPIGMLLIRMFMG